MAGAPSQTPLVSLQCSPDPLLDLKGLLLRRGTGGEGKCREVKGGREGRTRKGRRREGRGAKRKGRVGCGAHKAAGARVPALAKVQAISWAAEQGGTGGTCTPHLFWKGGTRGYTL